MGDPVARDAGNPMPVERYSRIARASLHSKELTDEELTKTAGTPHFARPSVTFVHVSGLDQRPENAMSTLTPL